MNTIKLHINGLTHYTLHEEAVRDEFLEHALGLSVRLCKMKFNDELKVAALISGNQVGNVERSDLGLAERALVGMGSDELSGTIVEVDKYLLTVDVQVNQLAELNETESLLKDWHYTGPLMPLNNDIQIVGIIVKLLKKQLSGDNPDEEEVKGAIKELCTLTVHDLSCEALDERQWMIHRLTEIDGSKYKKSRSLLHERGRVTGSDHGIADTARYMKHELPNSMEANAMEINSATSTDYKELLRQAQQLPFDLLSQWQNDEVAFARTLYILKPSREEIRRVLSCLIWLDKNPQAKLLSEFETIVDKCKDKDNVVVNLGNHYHGDINTMCLDEKNFILI